LLRFADCNSVRNNSTIRQSVRLAGATIKQSNHTMKLIFKILILSLAILTVGCKSENSGKQEAPRSRTDVKTITLKQTLSLLDKTEILEP